MGFVVGSRFAQGWFLPLAYIISPVSRPSRRWLSTTLTFLGFKTLSCTIKNCAHASTSNGTPQRARHLLVRIGNVERPHVLVDQRDVLRPIVLMRDRYLRTNSCVKWALHQST